jgi:CobQ-like glutamine amidotransferase family enzyme
VPVASSSDVDPAGGRDHSSALRVVVIYPDLLGTYGDGGNGRIVAARAGWRGIDVELVLARSDAPLPRGADIYCIGGGEDGPQIQAAERLADGALAAAVDGGAAVLAVCAGYQILGSSFPGPNGRRHGGLGLLDVDTVKGSGRRCVGEVVAQPLGADGGDRSAARVTGFENHGGLTTVGASAAPWARVLSGVGNGDGTGTDGARAGRIIATYLHGPVLARNPVLADLLLSLATGTVLEPLDDAEENALHDERLAASGATSTGGGRRWLLRTGRRWSRR